MILPTSTSSSNSFMLTLAGRASFARQLRTAICGNGAHARFLTTDIRRVVLSAGSVIAHVTMAASVDSASCARLQAFVRGHPIHITVGLLSFTCSSMDILAPLIIAATESPLHDDLADAKSALHHVNANAEFKRPSLSVSHDAAAATKLQAAYRGHATRVAGQESKEAGDGAARARAVEAARIDIDDALGCGDISRVRRAIRLAHQDFAEEQRRGEFGMALVMLSQYEGTLQEQRNAAWWAARVSY